MVTFSLCLLSLSQKLKAPSDPAVAKVPCTWIDKLKPQIKQEKLRHNYEGSSAMPTMCLDSLSFQVGLSEIVRITQTPKGGGSPQPGMPWS